MNKMTFDEESYILSIFLFVYIRNIWMFLHMNKRSKIICKSLDMLFARISVDRKVLEEFYVLMSLHVSCHMLSNAVGSVRCVLYVLYLPLNLVKNKQLLEATCFTEFVN